MKKYLLNSISITNWESIENLSNKSYFILDLYYTFWSPLIWIQKYLKKTHVINILWTPFFWPFEPLLIFLNLVIIFVIFQSPWKYLYALGMISFWNFDTDKIAESSVFLFYFRNKIIRTMIWIFKKYYFSL